MTVIIRLIWRWWKQRCKKLPLSISWLRSNILFKSNFIPAVVGPFLSGLDYFRRESSFAIFGGLNGAGKLLYFTPYCSKLLHFTLILLPREKILWRQDYRDWRTNHVWAGVERGERERRRAWEIMNSEVGGLQGKLWILGGFKGSFQGLVMHGGVKRRDKLCLHLVDMLI